MSVESDKNLSTFKYCDATMAVKVYDNLIAELRCPGCADPMKAPIKLCESGHAICQLCIKMLAKCPLCLKPFTEVRSLTLEAMSAKAQFKCSNSHLGCSVRMQLKLLDKHEDRCSYQLGHCFMGKVWENCKWHGREIDWIEHCEVDHREKVFFGAEVTRTWELKRYPPKSICAFFLFRVFNETFNFYQIYDKLRSSVYWTLVCASKKPDAAKRYCYEIELFSPSDEIRVIVQRNPCHSEDDADILHRSAVFGLGEIIGFMDRNRTLHYRIKIIETDPTNRMSTISWGNARSRFFETHYSQTSIEGGNVKRVPSDNIITRRTNNVTTCSNRIKILIPQSCMTSNSRNNLSSAPSSKESSPRNFDATKVGDVFTPITFGNRKKMSNEMSSQSERASSNETEMHPMGSRGHTIDSIDETIIENNDLKKIFIRSYNIDAKNIDDFFADEALKSANSVPKPPRFSLDKRKQNTEEVQGLLSGNTANGKAQQ